MRLVALLLALGLGAAAAPRGGRYVHETLSVNADAYRVRFALRGLWIGSAVPEPGSDLHRRRPR